MLIMSPTEAAAAIGVRCGGKAPTDDDPGLINFLRYLTPRLEAILGVESLTRGVAKDTFLLGSMPRIAEPVTQLLLSNGFLTEEGPSLTMPDGTVLALADLEFVNREEGHITLHSWARGRYTVQYGYGFEPITPPEPPAGFDMENRILAGIPDWMKSIGAAVLVLWFRGMRPTPGVSREYSFGQIDSAIRRELMARAYGKYMRPRVGVTFSEHMTRVS